jgi:hypothetical protein
MGFFLLYTKVDKTMLLSTVILPYTKKLFLSFMIYKGLSWTRLTNLRDPGQVLVILGYWAPMQVYLFESDYENE